MTAGRKELGVDRHAEVLKEQQEGWENAEIEDIPGETARRVARKAAKRKNPFDAAADFLEETEGGREGK